MRVIEYLAAVGESVDQFAVRAGVSSGTMHRVAKGRCNPRADIAERIIEASHDRPAPCGGWITLADLVVEPVESAA